MKYLFKAHFKDGSVFQQPKDDHSTLDPSKSSFYDVLQRADQLAVLGLSSEQTPNTFVVSLLDGHFEINGVSFMAGPSVEFPPDTKFRPIFFRRRNEVRPAGDVRITSTSATSSAGKPQSTARTTRKQSK
jgi:hypothetical protein